MEDDDDIRMVYGRTIHFVDEKSFHHNEKRVVAACEVCRRRVGRRRTAGRDIT